MNRYYLSELDNLREIAQSFAQSNPTLAPQLGQPSSDPDVERILEGVAFLTAGIRQKIDDDFPEFSQGLLNQIFPHYLRPIPSTTIMAFQPANNLTDRIFTPAGSYVEGKEVDSIKCRFRTTSDVEVSPVSIVSVQNNEASQGRRAIDIKLSLSGISLANWKVEDLPFYIGGDYQGAVDTFFILNHFLESIALIDVQGVESRVDDVHITPMGFEDDFQLLEYPANSFPAYRIIQEYFLLKEKFLFLKFNNIGQYLNKMSGNSVILRCYLNELPMQVPRFTPGRFTLHATPAINLFKHEAESFINDYRRSEYLLRPMRNQNEQYQIYTVDSVIGNNRKQAVKNDYTPMGSFDPDQNTSPVYQTYNRSTDGSSAMTYISFSYPKDHDLENKESVQVEITCSNGGHTVKLKVGDICNRTSGTSELVSFANILTPSESQQPPSGQSILWRLLSHLAINYLSLAETDNLKSLLELYIFSGHSGNKQELINRKRIDGIVDISVKACDRLIDGVSLRGQAIQVTVNATHYTSRGDMYLFGMLLDRVLGSFSSLNSFTEFSLLDNATDEVYQWPIRAGDRPLI
ncbi:MAG: type VI secretion system protein ImpG [Planctomycetota bacterium]|jgi:type VI secretion system protein ImpG